MAKKEINGHDRLPPHSTEAEQAVIGCCIGAPKMAIPICIEQTKGSIDLFYDVRHQTIYENLLQMYDAQVAIDVVTLYQHLKDKKKIDDAGGIAYVSQLPDIPVLADWYLLEYLEVCKKKALLRKLIRICTDGVARAYEESDPTANLDQVESQILKIRHGETTRTQKPILTLMREAIQSIDEMCTRQNAITGVPTGFVDLDKFTTGLQPGEVWVIAGRPSMGKTSLVMNIAEHAAVDSRVPVAVFSLEMTAEALAQRMLCSRARVNLRNVRDGFLADRDMPLLTGSSIKIGNSPIVIDDSSGITILELRAKARRYFQQFGIKLFVIDYLQLVHGNRRNYGTRQEEVSEVSTGVKELARELGVPTIALSQLNRGIDREANRKPRLSDLRESGSIEQDADFVGILYRTPKGENANDDQDTDAVPVNLLIGKQRNGPADVDVNFTFLKPYTRFESAAKLVPNDVPYNDRQTDMDYGRRNEAWRSEH